MQPRQINHADSGQAARGDDAVYRPGAEARHPQQIFAAGGRNIEREAPAVAQRPGQFGSMSSESMPFASSTISSASKP